MHQHSTRVKLIARFSYRRGGGGAIREGLEGVRGGGLGPRPRGRVRERRPRLVAAHDAAYGGRGRRRHVPRRLPRRRIAGIGPLRLSGRIAGVLPRQGLGRRRRGDRRRRQGGAGRRLRGRGASSGRRHGDARRGGGARGPVLRSGVFGLRFNRKRRRRGGWRQGGGDRQRLERRRVGGGGTREGVEMEWNRRGGEERRRWRLGGKF